MVEGKCSAIREKYEDTSTKFHTRTFRRNTDFWKNGKIQKMRISWKNSNFLNANFLEKRVFLEKCEFN